MRQHLLTPFEYSALDLRDHTILLDVDGTLLPEDVEELDARVRDAVARLKSTNTIYLVTNANSAPRVRRLAQTLMVTIAPVGVPAGKPFLRAARGIPTQRPMIVIGDKYLTDGLFARALSIPFIKIRSKRTGTERFTVRLAYFFDDIISLFL